MYDIIIHYIDPGIYLPVLCIGKTGKILTVNGQWSIVNKYSHIKTIHSQFTSR